MIVVGCGKAKLAVPARARDLYTGSLFRMARRYAEAKEARGVPWLILSAAHGVVEPNVFLRPYDQKLPTGKEKVEGWARLAADDIERRWMADLVGRALGRSVEILAGAAYGVPLARELKGRGIECQAPLAGLGLGKRLCRLKRMAEDLQRG